MLKVNAFFAILFQFIQFFVQIIDVGRCVGTCSGHVKGECLFW